MAKKRDPARSREHTKEVTGLLFLAVAVFVTLCLFSYNAFDPSFTTLAAGRRADNLGGIAGAYLADLVFVIWGLGGYLIPFALLAVSFTHFAERNLKDPKYRKEIGWKRIFAYLILIVFASLASHIRLGEVTLGGRPADAGGIIGFWLGGWSVRLFGRSGSYLLVISGLLLSVLTITRLSILRLEKFLRDLLFFFVKRGSAISSRFFVIAWARGRRQVARLSAEIQGRIQTWQKGRRPPKISRGPTIRRVEPVLDPPVPAPSLSSVLWSEPKILPRVDLKEMKKIDRREQLELILPLVADYQLPQTSFLDSESQEIAKVDEEQLKLNSRVLEKKLMDYGVAGRITEIHPGPIITMYEFEPAAGVKVNKIVNLEDDLSLTMGGKSVRIIAPLPGKPAVGIEIPNNLRETVWLKEVIGHPKFQKAESKLTLAFGKDTEGIPFVADLQKMPHLLVAGATGSGKSVQVNSMILSLLYKATPAEVRLIMIDPKMLELSLYEGIPHLLLPVVTNPRKASLALRWAVNEMERRYEILTRKGARNIAGYNKSVPKEDKLPTIVILIDELADLMMTSAKDVEASITRLAQMARAAGIHLIVATQRPSVDVITGLIKANFPARISFKVSSKHDARTILDTVGSEHLLGAGDMLFMSTGSSNLLRIHGAYVTETEILRVVEHWKKQGAPQYLDESIWRPMEEEEEGKGLEGEDLSDGLYDQAIAIVAETRQASISMIQRRLRVGYNRAARMIERMEKEGAVGPADGARPREVYVNNLQGL